MGRPSIILYFIPPAGLSVTFSQAPYYSFIVRFSFIFYAFLVHVLCGLQQSKEGWKEKHEASGGKKGHANGPVDEAGNSMPE